MTHRLQNGIYFESGDRPPKAYRLLLMNFAPAAPPSVARDHMAALWNVLQDLSAGRVRELEGQPADLADATNEQFASLKSLIAFGRRMFDDAHHVPPLTSLARPEFLAYLDRTSPFPSLPWKGKANPAECDVALQFTAESSAAVNCAAVEAWKAIEDDDLAFEPVVTYDGFGRLDGRGWLEFHDGVSNMPSDHRRAALEAGADPPWMEEGTYMAFLRIHVDLETWRRLDRIPQEIAIGRDKLTGSALESIEQGASGEVVPRARPFPGVDASSEEKSAWRDPPETTHPLIEASHVHRANQSRASPGAPGSLRMFRQGYEFLDAIGRDGPELGLNFVSFQRDLRIFQQVMHLPGWLGDVNFGGVPEPDEQTSRPLSFLGLEAGGFYAVPAREDPFPGAVLFRET